MEPEADKLIMENISKNLSDADEYPAMMYVLYCNKTLLDFC